MLREPTASMAYSHREEALIAIQTMGERSREDVPLGSLAAFGQWLNWPKWLQNGTNLKGNRVPQWISLAELLIMRANILDFGDTEYLINRSIRSRRLVAGPIADLIARNSPSPFEGISMFSHLIISTNTFVNSKLYSEKDRFFFQLETDLSLDRQFSFVCLVKMILVARMVNSLSACRFDEIQIELMDCDHHYASVLDEQIFSNIYWDRTINRISFPSRYVHLSNPNHDETIWHLVKGRCIEMKNRQSQLSFLSKIRNAVTRAISEQNRVPRLKQISGEIGISTRTIVRKLNEVGKSFHGIVEQERQKIVFELIKNREMSLIDIAIASGFTEQASFCRSFRQWHGDSPSKYRDKFLSR